MSFMGRDGVDPGSQSDDPDLLPDSGMASGTDAGQPGGHLGPGDLAPDEERLLAALERDARVGGVRPVEESIAMLRAAEDEAPLPAEGGAPDNGLVPRFTAPELGER